MIFKRTLRSALLATSAAAASMLAFTPALADAPPLAVTAPVAQATGATTASDAVATDAATRRLTDRLVAMGGRIRPFGGSILPYSGTIRGFAGDITGSSGTIRAFAGDAEGASGNIRAFSGNIRAFSGNIRAFQGDVLPLSGPDANFWGSTYPASGNIRAFSGNIRAFSGEFEAFSGNIRAFSGNIRAFDGTPLSYSAGLSTYQGLSSSLTALVAGSEATWGSAVAARTGQTFDEAFAAPLLAKYGIDLNDPRSLVGLNEATIELFLLDWNDNLMNYSGVDQVDHWMKAINWTPALTQSLGSGKDSRIGLLDFTVTGEGTSSIVKAGGISTVSGGHGSAVISLMTAAHDGRSVMGIAPGASVVSYNPFDETYTAGWTDIKNGVANLVGNGATIINMSLGVPGYTLAPDWNTVFSDAAISKEGKKRVFVLAAGNEGITQTTNVDWKFDKNPSFIVVGSVDPFGKISEFSNRPGTVCLTRDGECDSRADKLMQRFIVAPGEFILVADGKGGVTRMSGTSFAAPLVSGTIALIHDRWPWLAQKPADAVDIVLKSARDLGAPGTDAVYGRGMLDVLASMSPASLDGLKYKISVGGGKLEDLKVGNLTSTARAGMISSWEAKGAYLTAFENTLTSFRDFSIPLSSKLAGQTVGNSTEQFNSYLSSRFFTWFNNGGQTTSGKDDFASFSGNRVAAPIGKFGQLEVSVSASPKPYRPGMKFSGTAPETGFDIRSPEQGVAVRFGTGRGGAALGQQGFGLESDYDAQSGGANPFLGLASGGGYAAVDVEVARGLTVSTGIARQNAVRDFDRMAPDERAALGGIDPYRASANLLSVRYRVAPFLTTTASYTMLNEATGLLGVQSLDRRDFGNGTATDAGSFGADVAITSGLSLSASATVGRTRSGDTTRQMIAVGRGGALSTAYQLGVTKVGLFGQDRARVTLSQPLHVEHGTIDVTNVEVIDRATGELGNVVTTYDLQGQKRRLVGEMLYGRALMGGTANLNLFGRANLNAGADLNQPSLTMGGSFSVRF